MNRTEITPRLRQFADFLYNEERASGTISQYLRDVQAFLDWLGGQPLNKERALTYRAELLNNGIKPITVNAKLAALNGYFRFIGREDCRMHFLKIQRQLFRAREKELSFLEYRRLIDTAQARGKVRLALLLETIGATGIRVSEVRYITLEAAKAGRTEIAMKGKIRTILLPNKLCRKLLKYAQINKIASGEIFLTRSGNSLSRKQIWAEMKALCRAARVSAAKVFPHNLRHLFATVYYKACRDITRLADVLGHQSIETTRIYLITAGSEHQRQIEKLGMVL